MSRRVFTYKDAEDAKAFIGKKGDFGDCLMTVEKGHGIGGTLRDIRQGSHPFWWGQDGTQFFSPDPEPVEKWVPFTPDDAERFIGRAVKHKTEKAWGVITAVNEHGVFVRYLTTAMGFDTLLANFTFRDGTPCGKKVVE